MPVILHLIFNSSAQGVWLDKEVSRFKSYYTCYYNKYFQVKSDEDNPNRKKFVASLLEDALKKGEVAPTEPCVSWMCDPSLVWSRTLEDNLEIWAYFAPQGHFIESWGDCYNAQCAFWVLRWPCGQNGPVYATGPYYVAHVVDTGP